MQITVKHSSIVVDEYEAGMSLYYSMSEEAED